MERKQIIDKVIKLLALAEGTNQEGERKSAKEMAAKLMAQYDIDILEAKESPKFKTTKEMLKRKSPIPYDRMLWNCISNFNGVAYIAGSSSVQGYNIFVGRETDLEVNAYMIEIVFGQREVAWKKHMDEYKAKSYISPTGQYKIDWMRSFAQGVCY